jgi:hypothetical protein
VAAACECQCGAAAIDKERLVRLHATTGDARDGALGRRAHFHTFANGERERLHGHRAAMRLLHEPARRECAQIATDGVVRAAKLRRQRGHLDAPLLAQRGRDACLALLGESGSVVTGGVTGAGRGVSRQGHPVD